MRCALSSPESTVRTSPRSVWWRFFGRFASPTSSAVSTMLLVSLVEAMSVASARAETVGRCAAIQWPPTRSSSMP